MSEPGSVAAEHIWKRFRADNRRVLLRDEIHRLRARLRSDATSGWRWPLRDVSLLAQPGEALGLVGANGSGKSTLLRILNRVMDPHSGHVEVNGRIGALIEVRAGFHEDLTGRENAFLFGSLLGLSRREVNDRLDEIVAFAEIEEAVDRQVKFFSSGMQMRLGFAVAAFLRPDVLLVDEVLAVGDASFQQRCLDRMRAVLEEGTTLVFVSHDLAAMESVCSRAVWLDDGTVAADGPVEETLGAYRRFVERSATEPTFKSGAVQLRSVTATPADGAPTVTTAGAVELEVELHADEPNEGRLCIGVSEGTATPVFLAQQPVEARAGTTVVRCRLEHLPLAQGRYVVWLGMFARGRPDLVPWQPGTMFDVDGPKLQPGPRGIIRLAPIHVAASWDVERS